MLTLVKLNDLHTVPRGEAYIRMHKQGMISISPRLVQAMGLQHGDKVSFSKNEKDSYYLFKNEQTAEDAFTVRAYKSTKTLVFNSAKLCRAIVASYRLQFPSNSSSLVLKSHETPYQENGQSYFPLRKTYH